MAVTGEGYWASFSGAAFGAWPCDGGGRHGYGGIVGHPDVVVPVGVVV